MSGDLKTCEWPVTREEIADFCEAVLADNMPRHDEPWKTIANYIMAGRRRAYKIGFENGAATRPQSDRIEKLEEALRASVGHLMNAKIDLETGAPKATAIRTIEGGIRIARSTFNEDSSHVGR